MKRNELVTFEQDPQMVYVLQLGQRRYACRVLDPKVTGETSDPLVVRAGRVRVEYEDIRDGKWLIGDVALNQIHPMTPRISDALEKRRAQRREEEERERKFDEAIEVAQKRLVTMGVPAEWIDTGLDDEDRDDRPDGMRVDLTVGYYTEDHQAEVSMSIDTCDALLKQIRDVEFRKLREGMWVVTGDGGEFTTGGQGDGEEG